MDQMTQLRRRYRAIVGKSEEQIQRRQKRLLLLGLSGIAATFAGLALMAFSTWPIVSLAVFATGILALFFSLESVPAMRPLCENRELCSRAYDLVNMSPAAAAWRDSAVADGRQLRTMDAWAMEQLYRHEQHDITCKMLHKVPI